MVKVRFVAKEGSGLSDSDARVLGERFMALGQAGDLTAERVVEDARDPSSPTHPYFEWDDAKAAHQYRLGQARTYIASIRFVPSAGAAPKPIAIKIGSPAGQRYATVPPAMQDEEVIVDLIETIQRELERLQERYRTYAVLRPVLEGPIQEAKRELTRLAMELDIQYPDDATLPRRQVA